MAYINGVDLCKYYGITEGDKIRLFSGGNLLGTGAFIRVEGNIIIWMDRNANMNFTDLRVSSIQKVTACFDEKTMYDSGL
ncbi:hypothetical protein CN602_29420 [Bacillus cereus]|uniref:hypothetical protein n=1 Tax=Bacillus cereus TaxID=1396 RepID=UPI000BEF4E74|nr:hypothetical protein [Bacillus cereus]PEL93993.1 hypothetical protein CN602_29420 [Bacillus cereus]